MTTTDGSDNCVAPPGFLSHFKTKALASVLLCRCCRLIPVLIAYSDQVVGSPGFEVVGVFARRVYRDDDHPILRAANEPSVRSRRNRSQSQHDQCPCDTTAGKSPSAALSHALSPTVSLIGTTVFSLAHHPLAARSIGIGLSDVPDDFGEFDAFFPSKYPRHWQISHDIRVCGYGESRDDLAGFWNFGDGTDPGRFP